jgi:hypothetical protein
MVTTRSLIGVSLLVAVVAVSALGCATGDAGMAKAIGPNDLPSLAGKWVGNVILPSGRAEQGTLELLPNGDYVARAGALSAQGKAQVKEGGLSMTSTSTTGGLSTAQRTSFASVTQRSDGSLVLRGNGHSDQGVFSFDVSRAK